VERRRKAERAVPTFCVGIRVLLEEPKAPITRAWVFDAYFLKCKMKNPNQPLLIGILL
jgi:hypothetical protein